jgi:acyl-CoA thioesterase-2
VTADDEGRLRNAMNTALDGLLGALELTPSGEDRFRACGEPGRFDRVFGGQTLAQGLMAAGATVAGKEPQSLHAYFVEAGAPSEPVQLAVERVRDGRSIATRRVQLDQGGRTLLTMIASFHTNVTTNATGPERSEPPPPVPAPGELPSLQDWVPRVPDELREHSSPWVDRPPPIEMRIGEPPVFLGGAPATGSRSHWMRLVRPVGDDPLLHAALLAYASDFLLLDMAFRSHPERFSPSTTRGLSLDHSVWFHRPARFDQWHLHTQQTLALSGERGLIRGAIHDRDGHLVATAVQEVLVRQRAP